MKWRYGFQLVQNLNEKSKTNPKKQKKKGKRCRSSSSLSSTHTQMTKVERKALLQEQKQTLKAAWSSSSDDFEIEDGAARVPSNFKKFTIQDRKIVLQQPIRVRPENPGESYDGPEDAKKIDLVEPGRGTKTSMDCHRSDPR